MGREQSILVSTTIKTAPGLIVTSSFSRTQSSAQPLKDRFPKVLQTVWPVQEFTYMNPINWNGTTGEERTPSAHAYWERNDPQYNDGGGAESFAELIQRIEVVRELIIQQQNTEIVIFSHGLFTRAFWWRMVMIGQPINTKSMYHCVQFIRGLLLANCAIVKFRFEENQVWISGPHSKHLPPELITY